MSQAPDSQTTTRPPSSDGDDDPFLSLHKMSTTAGLGSQEYVAYNSVSVAAMVLGVASSLALLDPMLLVIALAGIVCGIIAARQISRSNGTQTGRVWAFGGMALSLLFAGSVGFREVSDYFRNRADERDITALVSRIDANVKAEKWDDLYKMFGSHFAERVKPEAFGDRWRAMAKSAYFGKIKSVTWNGKAVFYVNPITQTREARTLIIFGFEKSAADPRQEIVFQKAEGDWQIEDMPTLFPQEQPAGPRR